MEICIQRERIGHVPVSRSERIPDCVPSRASFARRQEGTRPCLSLIGNAASALFIEIALAKRGTRKKNSNIAQKFVSDRAAARFQALSPDFCFSSGAAGSRETVISQTKARYGPPSLFQKPDFALALEILPNKYTSAGLIHIVGADKNLAR